VADPNHVVQTTTGLHVRGTLDVADNRVAKQVHKLLKRRSLREFSFGYTVPPGGERRRHGANELTAIDLIEVGPTLKGANPATELHAVKSAMRGESNAPTVEDLAERERRLGLRPEDDLADRFYDVFFGAREAAEPTTTAVKAKSIDNRPIKVATFDC
jgi:hypothetical protein